jgi:hypothetical protein
MNPDVRCDPARFGQLDHVNRRRVSPLLARPAFQRRLQFPDRRIAQTPDRILQRRLNFKPAVFAIETLPDGRRRLRWPAIAFHLDRPCFRFGAVGSPVGFCGLFPAPSARIFAPRCSGHCKSPVRLRAHVQRLQQPLRLRAMPLGFEAWNGIAALQVEICNLYSITKNEAQRA